jgi:hypothetical protein
MKINAAPSGRDEISLKKKNSLLAFEQNGEAKRFLPRRTIETGNKIFVNKIQLN